VSSDHARLRAAGRALNAIKDERTAADYDETVVPSPEEASDAVQAAVDFLATCSARYVFMEPPEPAP
jgi:uncharacterized protein (UPF0332 family)